MPQKFVGFLTGFVLSGFALVISGVGLVLTFAALQAPTGTLLLCAFLVIALVLVVYLGAILASYLLAFLVEAFAGLTTFVSLVTFVLLVIGVFLIEKSIPVVPAMPALALFLLLLVAVPLFIWFELAIPKLLLTIGGYIGASIGSYVWPNTELFFRGANVGVNTVHAAFFGWLTYTVLFAYSPLMPLAPVLGILMAVWLLFVPLAGLMASTDEGMKSLLGWTSFLMPTSWLVSGLGAIFFLLSLSLHWLGALFPGTWLSSLLLFLRINVRRDYGTIITSGGLFGNLDLGGSAYNLGTFVLISSAYATNPSTTPANVTNIELHESGHGLSLSVFGSEFHFVGWLDEVPRLFNTQVQDAYLGAYAEQLAESNDPNTTAHLRVKMWS